MNNPDNILISVSIIASDLSTIGEEVKNMDKNNIDMLHMDVMDGYFVPNLTFGPGYISDLKGNTEIPLDVHLMIEKPENSIDEYIKINPWCITIHYESTKFPIRILKQIRDNGIKAGLTINPATPIESIYDLVQYNDLILIMSVDPGFYGQSFMESSIEKIRKLSNFIEKNNLDNKIIQVDGGINKDNISRVVEAGAGIIVAGSSAFKDGNLDKNVKELKVRAFSSK